MHEAPLTRARGTTHPGGGSGGGEGAGVPAGGAVGDDVGAGGGLGVAAGVRGPHPHPVVARADAPVTSARLFARLDRMLDEKTIVIADIGDALFGSADLTMSRRTEFISPAYYTSMGFAVPAAVGAGIATIIAHAPRKARMFAA